jgi:poly-beta-1,6-N-acetyl-D-glucosamine synthase
MLDVVTWLMWTVVILWAYAMLGYPLLMALCGLPKRTQLCFTEDQLPPVTMIIPAHNEEAVIEQKLKNTALIDYPEGKLQVLVVSDGSSDSTIPLAKSFESNSVRVIDFTVRRGKTSIVNDAVKQASGDVLCLCDTNVMFRPDALKILVSRLADARIGAVSGDVRLASHESDFGTGESLYYRFERAVQLGESFVGSMIGVDGGMYIIRRELFLPPPPETILDDFVISLQVILQGKKVVYEPRAIALENGTPSSEIEFRRRIRVTAGAVQTIRWGLWPSLLRQPMAYLQWFSHKFARWLSPVWLLIILICSILLWNQGYIYRLAVVGQCLAYGLAALAWVAPALRGVRLIGVCYYFALSHAAMLVGLYRGIRNQQKVTWTRTQRAAAS